MKLLMRRLFRWLKNSLLSIFVLIILLIGAVLFLIGTSTGTQWLVKTANSQLGNPIRYTELNGHLLGDLSLKGFEYNDKNMEININSLLLSWQPKDLLDKRFLLKKLALDGLYFEQKTVSEKIPEDEDSKTEAFKLPEIALPIDIVINELILNDLQLITAPDAEAIIVDHATLIAELIASKLTISQLAVKSPDIDASVKGHVVLEKQYPLDIKTDIQLHKTQLPQLGLQGTINGDLDALSLQQDLSGDVSGHIEADLQQVLSELTWNTNINLKEIPVRLLDQSLAENQTAFDAVLSGKGDLSTAEIQPLQLFLLKGDADNQSEGTLSLTGNVTWQPTLHWDLSLNTENVNPGVASPDIYGDISLHVETKGKQLPNPEKSEFDLSVVIKKLQGSLMDQALSGEGTIQLNKQLLTVQTLKLGSGDALVHINGKVDLEKTSTLAKPIDLTWDINVPALEQLVPNIKGKIKGKGLLSGTQEKPKAEGNLDIQQFVFEKNNINQAKVNFILSMDETFANNLSLSVDKVQLDANEIKDIQLTLDGPLTKHKLTLRSNVMDNQISLALNGGYKKDEQLWQGTLEQLSAKGKLIGSWQQKQASPLILSAKKAVLEQLCLLDRPSHICLNGQWQPEQSQALIDIKKLNLKRIESFLPPEIKELTGEVNLDGTVNMTEKLNAKLDLTLTPGIFSYELGTGEKIRLKHNKGAVHADYGDQQVTANLKLNLDEHSILGNIAIPTQALESDVQTAPLKGHVKLNIKDLGLVKIFVDEIEEIQGRVNADIKLGGIVSNPEVVGKVVLISEKISVPLVGIDFNKIDINLNATADKKVDIKGKIHSGQGNIALGGHLLMDADKKFPMLVTVKGDNFKVMDLPGMNAILTPDIKITNGQEGLKILGEVSIPQADVFLTTIPTGSKSVSDDVVLVGEGEEEEQAKGHLDLDVMLKLGEHVHIKAFGLDTHLTGQMTVKQMPGQIMTANGELRTTDGTFRALGQDLKIERAIISYAGGYLDNPGVNLKASKEIRSEDILVGVRALGTVKEMEVSTYSSDPTLDTKDIESLLLTGQRANSEDGARVYAGTAITENIDVGVNLGGGDEGSEFVVRYKLLKNMHIEGTSSSVKSGGSLMYTIELD